MSTFQRPAPDISKIVDAWHTWRNSAEALPGRTMADLKIGGVDTVLGALAGETESVATAYQAWLLWEKGKSTPEVALQALSDGGFDDVVEALNNE